MHHAPQFDTATAGAGQCAPASVRLPQRVQDELDAAERRTGRTAALVLARHRLAILFSLTPAQLERVTADIYQRTI